MNLKTMHINLEATEQHAVQSYSDTQIQINSIMYSRSLIVSREEIISDITIKSIQEINQDYLNQILQLNPEVIIIGHGQAGIFPPMDVISQLSQKRIGIECMSIGAAARTFNILLSEHRNVVAGFLLVG